MRIQIGFDMVFTVPAPTPMVMLLYLHPSRAGDLENPEILQITPDIPIEDYLDSFGNRCARIMAPAGELRLHSENVIYHSGQPDEIVTDAIQHPIEDLPHECLQYLLGSRYCEVDVMGDKAWELFGNTPPGWARVQAICDWVHNHVTFGYQYARHTKTALDVLNEGQGVCRDFQHLALTFCRCMNIPARYATGYIGDIGIPPVAGPMDFSAWFQVFLGGRWYDFDARFNVPRIGRNLMAVGRDAVDVALTTSFGPTRLDKFLVVTDEIKEGSDTAPKMHDSAATVEASNAPNAAAPLVVSA